MTVPTKKHRVAFITHVLDLMKPTAACAGANFEVDLVTSGKNKAFDADYAWSVKNEKITIQNVPVTDLDDAEAALDHNFDRVCPKPRKHLYNSLVAALLRMVE